MKNLLLSTGMMLALTVTPGCGLFQSARDKLANMTEQEFTSLRQNVEDAGEKAGEELVKIIDEPTKEIVVIVTDTLLDSLRENKIVLNTHDVVGTILEHYQWKLSAKEMQLIRDAAQIIDAAVGQIRVDITGSLTEREKALIDALLSGLKAGLEEE